MSRGIANHGFVTLIRRLPVTRRLAAALIEHRHVRNARVRFGAWQARRPQWLSRRLAQRRDRLPRGTLMESG
jgi:hypothetical protein